MHTTHACIHTHTHSTNTHTHTHTHTHRVQTHTVQIHTVQRERALTTGLCSEWWYSEHTGVCRRAEQPGRSVNVKKFWKADWGLMRNDVKAKQRQLVFDPLLTRKPVKRWKHSSDIGRSRCSENESGSIALYVCCFRKKILGTACQKRAAEI